MAIIGFILLLIGIAGAAFGLWVAMSTAATTTSVAAFGNTLNIAPMTMLLLGAASILLVLLGLWMMFGAGRRKMRDNKERRELEKLQREQEKELAETHSRLAKQNEARLNQAQTSTGSPRIEESNLGRDNGATIAEDPRDLR
ncbi:tetraspanin family protein [Gephyromycinifex aptenodytis]|uniref:tetraspanin family protein n=1 Tax=Gephyromycinifex aptenodytis TaxID=2716227 RepID=UPI00144790A4|nr:tetraspanin family protein [Gephyromycinifex aptenodytis]